MSDPQDPQTPRFTVIDRRKLRDEDETPQAAVPPVQEEVPKGPARLTLVEPVQKPAAPVETAAEPLAPPALIAVEDAPDDDSAHLPPAPSAEQLAEQKIAYEVAADRINDLIRAQNPAMPAPEKIGFEHLVQQLYLSAMMQMGAGTPEGQRPRIDILGARQSIDLLGVTAEKTRGSLTAEESRTLDTVIYEVRMTFLELTRMISTQPPVPPMPGGPGR